MSNPSGRDSARRAAEAASQPEAQAAPEPGNGTPPQRKGQVHLKSPQSLERLRDRVREAARELERLRKENTALATRIRELEARPAVDAEGTLLIFDEDPDVLREKVEGFIEALDKYLARAG